MIFFNYIYYHFNLFFKKINSRKNFYSYSGIDLLVSNIFKNSKKGFYVDVGAQHPIKNNNTYLLFKKGWEGINIDLDKKNIELFKIDRKRDSNINEAVYSSKVKKKLYYYHDGSPINTMSLKVASYQKAKIKEIRNIQTTTLDMLIAKTRFKNRQIDFLTIDVEGLELDVLHGLSLKKYKPKIVVVEYLDLTAKKLELINLDIKKILSSKVYKFMIKNNYTMINWLHSDIIFVHNRFKD